MSSRTKILAMKQQLSVVGGNFCFKFLQHIKIIVRAGGVIYGISINKEGIQGERMGKVAKFTVFTVVFLNTLVMAFLLWSQLDSTSHPSVGVSGADSNGQTSESLKVSSTPAAASAQSRLDAATNTGNDGATSTGHQNSEGTSVTAREGQAAQSLVVNSTAAASAPTPTPLDTAAKTGNDGATDTTTATGHQRSVGETFLTLATQRSQQHCVPKIDQLSRFLGINEKDAAVLSYYNKDQSDDQLVSTVLASKGVQGGQLAVLDVSQGPGCAATYELIKVWTDGCDRVVASATRNIAKNDNGRSRQGIRRG
ncbi:MAG: hypothetical protein V7731_24455 [Amphritea sp.]